MSNVARKIAKSYTKFDELEKFHFGRFENPGIDKEDENLFYVQDKKEQEQKTDKEFQKIYYVLRFFPNHGMISTATDYTATSKDYVIAVVNTAAARTITLPLAAKYRKAQMLIVKDESGGAAANNITIDGNGAETIDGAATTVINTNYGAKRLYSNGTSWFNI